MDLLNEANVFGLVKCNFEDSEIKYVTHKNMFILLSNFQGWFNGQSMV